MADTLWNKLIRRPEQGGHKDQISLIQVQQIKPNPFQPRRNFDEAELQDLSNSIKTHGLLQPIVVAELASAPNEYTLVVGERRLRAAQMAGLIEIPAIVGVFGEQDLAEVALVENLQRKDLNPIEEAAAYRGMLDRFELTQQQLGERIGKSQSAVANKLRLLNLPAEIQEGISREIISERHGRLLLSLPSQLATDVAGEIVKRGLSVKQTEVLVRRLLEERQSLRGKKVIRIFKDVRLFRNSVLQLIKEMQAGGLEVAVDEDRSEDGYRITIDIKKSKQGA